jgi:hypothetical protein
MNFSMSVNMALLFVTEVHAVSGCNTQLAIVYSTLAVSLIYIEQTLSEALHMLSLSLSLYI